jgi:hypothetical protein
MAKDSDMVGRVYGSLTGKSFLKKRDKCGHVRWKWSCTCGTMITRSVESILKDIKNKVPVCCSKCAKT